jgi:uncharacterized Fe-S cluster protein YjdI
MLKDKIKKNQSYKKIKKKKITIISQNKTQAHSGQSAKPSSQVMRLGNMI